MYCVVSSVKPPVNSSSRRIKFPRGKAKNGETQLTVPRALQSMDVLQGLNPNLLCVGRIDGFRYTDRHDHSHFTG